MSVPATAGPLYLIDTSAHARITHDKVRDVLAALVVDGLAATCITVDLQAGYSGRNHEEVTGIYLARRQHYTTLPITEAIAERARRVQISMARAGHHRAAGVIDLLTAAVAEHHGAVLLHYDADFEHIAAVTGQPHQWVAPRGSIS